jgi:ABC-2 type transport system ATP-binding protein
VLSEAGYDVHALPDARLQVGTTGRPVLDAADLSRLLGERGLWVRELTPVAADLETAFLEITQGQGLGETPGSPSAQPAPEGARP